MSGSHHSADTSVGRPADPIRETTLVAIEAHLRQRELRRDDLFQRARQLRRLAQHTMVRLHERAPADADLAEVRRVTTKLADYVHREARGDENIALDAFQEAVEAILLGAVLANAELPGPADLGVEPEPYLLGMGDLVGELRRVALDQLSRGDLAEADGTLVLMDRLVRVLMRFDTTRAIVALKPKQDVARALLERTRGDVTVAHMFNRRRPSEDGVSAGSA
jgi:translin